MSSADYKSGGFFPAHENLVKGDVSAQVEKLHSCKSDFQPRGWAVAVGSPSYNKVRNDLTAQYPSQNEYSTKRSAR